MTEGWSLALYFDDQSPSYAHGFEAGQFWAEMKQGVPTIERMVMDEAVPMLRRMADHQSYILEVKFLEHGWAEVKLEKTLGDPVKQRLTVVEGGLSPRPGVEE